MVCLLQPFPYLVTYPSKEYTLMLQNGFQY
jgi:hypothetical protein